jgi:CheY-like chemotaxis protein
LSLRVLIVEDEQIIAADLEGKLEKMGHQVVGTAISGEEAIALADQMWPQLVMMDIQLRGEIDGTEAARTIQARTGAEIIFITAFPGVFLKHPSGMPKPGICLIKPFSKQQLEAALSAENAASPTGRKQTIH